MIGDSIAHYTILRKLGQGGMGEVFLARDEKLGRKIALKILPPEAAASQERLDRFRREAKAVAALSHPNIVTIFSVEEVDGLHFLTMEYVEGKTLSEVVPGSGLDLERFFEIAIALADALSSAHEHGIIHRDLKPRNIMVGRDGRVRILDFGLAKLLRGRSPGESEVDSRDPTDVLTGTDRIVGTTPFMSPEQLQGLPLDARSDVFSLGIVFYLMATGGHPFRRDSSAEIISAILAEDPPSVAGTRKDYPRHIGRLIRHCLEKDSSRRFQTALDVRNELKDLRHEVSSESTTKSPHPVSRIPSERQAKLWPILSSLLVVLLLGVGAWKLWGPTRPQVRDLQTLAVLPFTAVDPDLDQQDEYLEDGISEQITAYLTRLPGLRVISTSSVLPFKQSGLTPVEIGRSLGVDSVLAGTVREAGSRIRIVTQLIEVASGRNRWAANYDRPRDEMFAVHSEIANDTATALVGDLTITEQERLAGKDPGNSEAYVSYLRARYFLNKRSERGLHRGLELFQQAIDLAPRYAAAYAGLAESYILLGLYGYETPTEAHNRAREAAEMALEIDDSLADAHLAVAMARYHNWEWEEAGREFDRAVELNPGLARAYRSRAFYLVNVGERQEAVASAQFAQELDPATYLTQIGFAGVLQLARDYAAAIEQYRVAIDMEPRLGLGHALLAQAYANQGQNKLALEALAAVDNLDDDSRDVELIRGLVMGKVGRLEEARAVAEAAAAAAAESRPAATDLALIYSAMGESDTAFIWLETAYRERDPNLVYLGSNPGFDPLRHDPRFGNLLVKVGLSN